MNLAFWICIIGGAVYLLLTWVGKGAMFAELGRIAFGIGLLAFLLGK